MRLFIKLGLRISPEAGNRLRALRHLLMGGPPRRRPAAVCAELLGTRQRTKLLCARRVEGRSLLRTVIHSFAMVIRLICGVALLAGWALAIERGEEMRLWAKGAPGSEGETAPEVFQAGANPKLPTRFTVVHYPSIYVFLPAKEKANGMAVVVAPGGGHSQLVIGKEGYDIADWLNKNGIAAFVLKYRLARAKDSHYTVPGNALPDAARAMRMVRSRAKEWHVDPSRIGFMGFSAGGEVAELIETRFDAGNDSSSDPIERASSIGS